MSKTLSFCGTVEAGDSSRVYEEAPEGAIRIGGRDVVGEVMSADIGKCRVPLNGNVIADGIAGVSLGWGYSEWTPIDDDSFSVEGVDVIEAVEKLKGQSVLLVIEELD